MTEQTPIFEHVEAGRRLGRHIKHDPRSLEYPAAADGGKKTVRWERAVPVFDQGDIGSCTGNASAGVLGTAPFYDTIKDKVSSIDETFAVKIYEAATRDDDFPGQYLPTDTGSTGLGAAKALKALGLISGYTHILSIEAAYTAIQAGPFIVGTNWMSTMDEPDVNGVVQVGGYTRGGHEYQIIGFDAENDLWEAVNSWGYNWGVGGHFFIPDAGFRELLGDDGDATVFVPLTEPAPTPVPVTPKPDPEPSGADEILWSAVKGWVGKTHRSAAMKAVAVALKAWATEKGLE